MISQVTKTDWCFESTLLDESSARERPLEYPGTRVHRTGTGTVQFPRRPWLPRL